MRTLLRTLHDDSDVTTVFVTHDQAEAVEVADTIALMIDGTLAGHGTPQSYYTRPQTLAAARFFGITNEITGHVSRGRFVSASGPFQVPTKAQDGAAVLLIRPEAIRLATHPSHRADEGWGVVVAAHFAGTHLAVDVAIGGQRLRVHLRAGRPIGVGEAISVELPPEACTVFPAEAA